MDTNPEHISLYTSLFRGRDDVYARRWEKDAKSGWSPAYTFDWNKFNAHRAHGGTLKDFKNKTLLPLTDGVIANHLGGKETVGIYPILSDNTSYFIAADFDETSWKDDARCLVDKCTENDLLAYSEISRGGNGAHVWVFFEMAYPCFKSWKIMLTLIAEISPQSEFKKEDSFDRLFPNQDTVADGGFGNLIGAPLQGHKIKEGCTVFYNTKTDAVYENLWQFLKTVHKHSIMELDSVYEKVCFDSVTHDLEESTADIQIHVGGNISLNRN